MKWLASSITDLIRRHVELTVARGEAEGREIRVMLQSLPAPVVRRVCSDLSDWLAAPDSKWIPTSRSPTPSARNGRDPEPSVRADFDFIEGKGWWDEKNHLTHYRNQISTNDDRFLLILLVGVDQVTDQVGLEDFYLVDRQVIWNQHLDGSFESWLKPWFTERAIACEEDHLEQIDLFLQRSCLVRSWI